MKSLEEYFKRYMTTVLLFITFALNAQPSILQSMKSDSALFSVSMDAGVISVYQRTGNPDTRVCVNHRITSATYSKGLWYIGAHKFAATLRIENNRLIAAILYFPHSKIQLREKNYRPAPPLPVVEPNYDPGPGDQSPGLIQL